MSSAVGRFNGGPSEHIGHTGPGLDTLDTPRGRYPRRMNTTTTPGRRGLALAASALVTAMTTLAAASPADDRLHALLDAQFQSVLEADPISASERGRREFDHRLPDLSAEARRADLEAARARLTRLNDIPEDDLTPANRVNARLLRWELQRDIEGAAFDLWMFPLSRLHGPQTTLPQLADNIPIAGEAQELAYLERLGAVPAYIDQTIANMRAGVEAGKVPPRAAIEGAEAQCFRQALLGGADPMTHAMFKPFAGRNDKRATQAAIIIERDIAPAFSRLGAFLRDEYLPACRDTVGISDMPGGREYYDFALKGHTTLDLTADQIHETGLKEVARIKAEMMGVIARSDFPRKNELQGDELFGAFTEYLRTDERFYFDTAEELLAAYRDIAKRIDGEMPRLFRKLPRLPYGVREMPSFMAAESPTAYYYPGSPENGVAGFFVANTYALDQRPKYEMIALTLHEAVPGHHHQIALAQELADGGAGLHEWRTTLGYTGFVEGWALYAERLGLEMGDPPHGLFTDPYDDFGRLSYEMWRAMRLVVDTGIHSKGWTRQQAIDYMLANSGLSQTNIEREVDRYIGWPGQATAYKIGELHIRALRASAERELGDRFDLRGFNDALLENGAVPLEVLTEQIEAWVAEQ